MRNQGGHITGKVLAGYILLVALAVCSVGYIYNIVKTIVEEDVSPDSLSREKVYLITNTLSLMYESEAMGQFVGIEPDRYYRFNQTLNRVHANMDSLRALISDSAQLLKIDTIDILLDRKRWNTRRLMEAWEELNTDRLFTENIERVISRDTIVSRPAQQVEVRKRVEVKQDTVVVPRKRRGFFRRLAEVFSPTKEDTSFVVNTTRQVLTDTVIQAYNPTDTIVSVLKSLQDSVAGQRKHLMDRLLERSANLRYSNTIISREINQMLRDIEEEEMEVSLNRLYRRQELLREMSVMGAEIIGAFIFVAVIFLILIWRDVAKSKYDPDLARRGEKQVLPRAAGEGQALRREPVAEPREADADDQSRYPRPALFHYRLYRVAVAPASGRTAALLSGEYERLVGPYSLAGE